MHRRRACSHHLGNRCRGCPARTPRTPGISSVARRRRLRYRRRPIGPLLHTSRRAQHRLLPHTMKLTGGGVAGRSCRFEDERAHHHRSGRCPAALGAAVRRRSSRADASRCTPGRILVGRRGVPRGGRHPCRRHRRTPPARAARPGSRRRRRLALAPPSRRPDRRPDRSLGSAPRTPQDHAGDTPDHGGDRWAGDDPGGSRATARRDACPEPLRLARDGRIHRSRPGGAA